MSAICFHFISIAHISSHPSVGVVCIVWAYFMVFIFALRTVCECLSVEMSCSFFKSSPPSFSYVLFVPWDILNTSMILLPQRAFHAGGFHAGSQEICLLLLGCQWVFIRIATHLALSGSVPRRHHLLLETRKIRARARCVGSPNQHVLSDNECCLFSRV